MRNPLLIETTETGDKVYVMDTAFTSFGKEYLVSMGDGSARWRWLRQSEFDTLLKTGVIG